MNVFLVRRRNVTALALCAFHSSCKNEEVFFGSVHSLDRMTVLPGASPRSRMDMRERTSTLGLVRMIMAFSQSMRECLLYFPDHKLLFVFRENGAILVVESEQERLQMNDRQSRSPFEREEISYCLHRNLLTVALFCSPQTMLLLCE